MLKTILILAAVFGAILLISSCGRVKATLANQYAAIKSDYVKKADVSYGKEARQKLDLYLPENYKPDTPIIVFFYGGSWQSGSRGQYEFVAQPFIEQGYAVAIPDYAKYPEYRYPVFMEDAALAVNWLVENANNYKLSANNIVLMGHSAGGHMAALLATNPQYLGQYYNRIKALVGISGAYDFVPKDKDIKAIFSAANPVSKAMPATYVDGKQSPMLLIWGDNDTIVGKRNIDRMQQAVEEKGGAVEIYIAPGMNHGDTVAALSLLKRDIKGSDDIIERITEFLKGSKIGSIN